MTLFHDLYQITKKDLKEFVRDRLRLVTFIIMPLFMMVLTGFIFPSQSSIKNIKIGVANEDGAAISQQLVSTITNFMIDGTNHAFAVTPLHDLAAVQDAIRKQHVNGGIVIPQDFSGIVSSGKQANVTIVQDESNPQISGLTTQAITRLVTYFSQQRAEKSVQSFLSQKDISKNGGVPFSAQAMVVPVTASITGTIAGKTNYFDFVAPGIIAMVVMTAVLAGLAASVSHEREQGTLDGILIAPVSRLAIILGKALSQAIRGLAQGAVVLLLAIFLFGVTIHGNLLLVLFLLLLGIFSFVGLGILVSAAAAEQETATQVLFMFQFPMLFLSGAFFPLQQMPKIMQSIAHILPLTYAVEALRKVMVLGAGLPAVSTELIVLAGFGIVTLAIAVPLFQRMITK